MRRFSRYHKYTLCTNLRQQALAVMRGVHMAVYYRLQQAHHIQAPVREVDPYKLTRQLAIVFARRPWLGELFNLAKGGSLTAAAPALWQVLRRRCVRQILKPERETS